MDPTLSRTDHVTEAVRVASDRLRAISDRFTAAIAPARPVVGEAPRPGLFAAIAAAVPRPHAVPDGFPLRQAPAAVAIAALVTVALGAAALLNADWRVWAAASAPLLLSCLRRERGAVTWSLALVAVAIGVAVAVTGALAVHLDPILATRVGGPVIAAGLALALGAPVLGAVAGQLAPGRGIEHPLAITALWRLTGLVLVPIGLGMAGPV